MAEAIEKLISFCNAISRSGAYHEHYLSDLTKVLHNVFEYRREGRDETGRELGRWICGGSQARLLRKCEQRGVEIPLGVLKVDD